MTKHELTHDDLIVLLGHRPDVASQIVVQPDGCWHWTDPRCREGHGTYGTRHE